MEIPKSVIATEPAWTGAAIAEPGRPFYASPMAAHLVQLRCPQCGAGLPFEPTDEIVTCRYCGTTCSIESLRQAAKGAPSPRGNQAAVALAVLGGFVALLGVGIAVLVASSTRMGSTSPVRGPLPPVNVPPSQACEKAVGCCRAVMSVTGTDPTAQRACEAMRAMSDADCMQQFKTLRESARTMGKRCD